MSIATFCTSLNEGFDGTSATPSDTTALILSNAMLYSEELSLVRAATYKVSSFIGYVTSAGTFAVTSFQPLQLTPFEKSIVYELPEASIIFHLTQ